MAPSVLMRVLIAMTPATTPPVIKYGVHIHSPERAAISQIVQFKQNIVLITAKGPSVKKKRCNAIGMVIILLDFWDLLSLTTKMRLPMTLDRLYKMEYTLSSVVVLFHVKHGASTFT